MVDQQSFDQKFHVTCSASVDMELLVERFGVECCLATPEGSFEVLTERTCEVPYNKLPLSFNNMVDQHSFDQKFHVTCSATVDMELLVERFGVEYFSRNLKTTSKCFRNANVKCVS